jgi:hypothetical protein
MTRGSQALGLRADRDDLLIDFPGVLARHAGNIEDPTMVSVTDWFIPALIGTMFTLLGSLKLYGLSRGIVGGADKPFVTKLCDT